MRKIFVFLSCLITVPAIAAGDACTKPKEFTVDKRCYVTEEQKKQKPFNATVDIGFGTYCTGTLVKGYHGYNGNEATPQEKETIYVYTAKHCTDRNKDGISDTYLNMVLQNGNMYTIKFARAGWHNTVTGTKPTGDYALYTIDKDAYTPSKEKIPYTTISDKWGFWGQRQLDARVVGNGSLKIMSDKEIETFKNKYINFLKTEGQNSNTGMSKGGVKINSEYGKKFLIQLDSEYYIDLFTDSGKLKVSKCKYSSSGKPIGCQAWGGNSGGGIFDNNGKLMGILTRSALIIGGTHHAGSVDKETTSTTASIPIAF